MGDAIVLDCETTGFDPEHDRVIELSILPWRTGDVFLFDWRINPGRAIPSKITEITSISDEMVRDLPRIDAHAKQLCEIITSAEAVIGYNVAFDQRMINADLKRCGYEPTWPILVDAMRVWDVCEPREKRDLQNAYRRFVSKEGFLGAHGAAADVVATRDTLRGQFDEFNLHGVPWDQLDPSRKSWWGPSKHVIYVEGVLTTAFGKHEGRPVDEVDTGFWSWVSKKDFPDHVILLAMKLVELSSKYRGRTAELRTAIHTWAKEKIP